jgi:hypothetical protein
VNKPFAFTEWVAETTVTVTGEYLESHQRPGYRVDPYWRVRVYQDGFPTTWPDQYYPSEHMASLAAATLLERYLQQMAQQGSSPAPVYEIISPELFLPATPNPATLEQLKSSVNLDLFPGWAVEVKLYGTMQSLIRLDLTRVTAEATLPPSELNYWWRNWVRLDNGYYLTVARSHKELPLEHDIVEVFAGYRITVNVSYVPRNDRMNVIISPREVAALEAVTGEVWRNTLTVECPEGVTPVESIPSDMEESYYPTMLDALAEGQLLVLAIVETIKAGDQ